MGDAGNPTHMSAIELQGVTKRFGDVAALQRVDLEVEEGEIFGFLGPNGAGKSTTINLVLDFVRPSEGAARVFGLDAQRDSAEIKDRVGVLPEGYEVYERLTGREHVQFAIESKDATDDPDVLLDRTGLAEDVRSRKAGGYSSGERQRTVLAMALVGEPDLLILDEPSTGLDPNGAKMMRELVREENERGATVFFSSHILGQVEAVCDTVGILDQGELIAKDSVDGLRDAKKGGITLVAEVASDEFVADALEALEALDAVDNANWADGSLQVACDSGAKMPVLNAIEEAGVEVTDFETEETSLEDLFAAYTEGER
jgi:ABC-2 type transport system ATP-binding protein